jgi:hypothetical protein
VVVRLLLELQTSDAGSAVALGFLFHDAVAAYVGNANGGGWRYNNLTEDEIQALIAYLKTL